MIIILENFKLIFLNIVLTLYIMEIISNNGEKK